MPKVKIDGKTVSIRKEATILDAVRRAGAWVPALCHNPTLPALGTCRICMVEMWEEGWNLEEPGRLVTACNYPVRGDITVSVAGDRPVRMRRGVMELLLARSPESPELHQMAARMGFRGTPYPKVTESQRNCILCGLCVSVCDEVIGASAIGFAGRGVERVVATPFRLASETCIACGACAAVCPVGTIIVRIHEETAEAEISPFKNRVKLLVCERCGRHSVAVPVAQATAGKVKMDWDEFRRLARLCPDCRRKQAVAALGLAAPADESDSKVGVGAAAGGS